jgi:hypothetical protein
MAHQWTGGIMSNTFHGKNRNICKKERKKERESKKRNERMEGNIKKLPLKNKLY